MEVVVAELLLLLLLVGVMRVVQQCLPLLLLSFDGGKGRIRVREGGRWWW